MNIMHPVDAATHQHFALNKKFPVWMFTNAEWHDIMNAARRCAVNVCCLWQIAATMSEEEWSVAALVAGYKEALRS